ncbi:hypothetical protein GGR50DRAFT_686965 [Xylaria sp. CBS 124048]|nr:hypothetical protein GGR50DRAFT_686965 [Xylaria sp. CBS 124048]
MAQGTSYRTVSTVYSSFEVVDVFTYDANSQLTYYSEEWWSFGSPNTRAATTLTTAATTSSTPTGDSVPGPTHTSGNTPHSTITSPGLSTGVIIGISIGAALVGGILGFIVGRLLARRGQKRKPVPEYSTYSDREKEPVPSTSAATDGGHSGLRLEQYLPESIPDKAIAAQLKSLGRVIQQHAETHYHLRPVQLESGQLRQALHDLGIERGNEQAIARLASLALDPRTRLKVIRYVIAKVAFESTVIGGDTCLSLLPPTVSAFSSSAPPLEDHVGCYEATQLAMARWRQLSAFLLHPHRSRRTPLAPSSDVSTQQAQSLTLVLNRFLQPFVSSDREERYEQENHLREVIVECATFGYVLFSQAAEYRFLFDGNGGGGGGGNTIVVCPGLDKLIDGEGRRCRLPMSRVVAPLIESV